MDNKVSWKHGIIGKFKLKSYPMLEWVNFSKYNALIKNDIKVHCCNKKNWKYNAIIKKWWK